MPVAKISHSAIVAPRHMPEPDETNWNWVLYQLTAPREKACTMAEAGRVMQRYAVAEMIRLRWDSRFKISGPREMKSQGKVSGEVLNALLVLISEVCVIRSDCPHPAIWFYQIVNEWEIQVEVHHCKSSDIDTKGRFLEMIRKQNNMLLKVENPFERPETKAFFDIVVTLANSLDRFRSGPFKKFRRARERATAHLSKRGNVLLQEENGMLGLPSRQGRKKGAVKPP